MSNLQHTLDISVTQHPNCLELSAACCVRDTMYTSTLTLPEAVKAITKAMADHMNCDPSRFHVKTYIGTISENDAVRNIPL